MTESTSQKNYKNLSYNNVCYRGLDEPTGLLEALQGVPEELRREAVEFSKQQVLLLSTYALCELALQIHIDIFACVRISGCTRYMLKYCESGCRAMMHFVRSNTMMRYITITRP